ncbi:hypothetical protein M6C35_002031 [Vibrio metschnikovii]|nr:hypothetical protein [Vibrio metschnikovii]
MLAKSQSTQLFPAFRLQMISDIEACMPLDAFLIKWNVSANDSFSNIFPGHYYIPADLLHKRLRRGTARFEDGSIEKLCPTCNDFWPLTATFWHGNSNSKDGAFFQCKACEADRKRGIKPNTDISDYLGLGSLTFITVHTH